MHDRIARLTCANCLRPWESDGCGLCTGCGHDVIDVETVTDQFADIVVDD